MKNKIITFLLAMGMPVSALYVQSGGCTGCAAAAALIALQVFLHCYCCAANIAINA